MAGHPWSDCCREKVHRSVLCCLKPITESIIHYRDCLPFKVLAKQLPESSIHTLPSNEFEEQIYTTPKITDLQCMLY